MPFDHGNWITIVVIGCLLVGVLLFGVNVGMGAFTGAVLIALLEKTEGLDLVTSLLARFATPRTITGVIAFVTGLVSVYSSTSGVVLPAFLPMIPGLVQQLGGGNPVSIATSMNVGGHLVDISPLSTTGALCLAAIPASEDVRKTFNQLLAWGLSMTVVGAIICYLFF